MGARDAFPIPVYIISGMCKSANPRCACVHIRKSRMCKSANPRCACVHVRKSRTCKSANPRCACVHIRKSQMCMCAHPQIADVHVTTAATYRATVLCPISVHMPCYLCPHAKLPVSNFTYHIVSVQFECVVFL